MVDVTRFKLLAYLVRMLFQPGSKPFVFDNGIVTNAKVYSAAVAVVVVHMLFSAIDSD